MTPLAISSVLAGLRVGGYDGGNKSLFRPFSLFDVTGVVMASGVIAAQWAVGVRKNSGLKSICAVLYKDT